MLHLPAVVPDTHRHTREHTQVHMHTCTRQNKTLEAPPTLWPCQNECRPDLPGMSALPNTIFSTHQPRRADVRGKTREGGNSLGLPAGLEGGSRALGSASGRWQRKTHLLGHLLGAKRRPLTPQPRPSPAQTLTHTQPQTQMLMPTQEPRNMAEHIHKYPHVNSHLIYQYTRTHTTCKGKH